jgi:Skp family chaperone for outer membrane proteins
MKFLTITLGVILATSLIMSCGNKSTNSSANDNKENALVVKRDKNPEGLNIAYYVQDSIGRGFNFYREIDSMLRSKQRKFEGDLRGRYESYQRYEDEIRRRMENNEITGYEIEGIEQEMMRRQQMIASFERQEGGKIQREAMEYQSALMNKIAEAGREFSEENGFDMLFFYQKGGQITYISNAYDVTDEFIAFLNQRENMIKSDVEKQVEEGDDSLNDDVSGLNITK